jgi:hypothetical protein
MTVGSHVHHLLAILGSAFFVRGQLCISCRVKDLWLQN